MTINFPPWLAKSWKSSLIGLISGALAVQQAFAIQDWQVFKNPAFQIKVLVFVMGLIVKDNNVSGGTVSQQSSPEVITALKAAVSQPTPKE